MAPWQGMLLVGAVIRRAGEVLLVREALADGSHERWGIPGGRVEPDELLHEAVVREVREETGLEVRALGGVAFVSHHHNPAHPATALLVAYEVTDFEGMLRPDDPDGFIREARFVPLAEGIQLITETAVGP